MSGMSIKQNVQESVSELTLAKNFTSPFICCCYVSNRKFIVNGMHLVRLMGKELGMLLCKIC